MNEYHVNALFLCAIIWHFPFHAASHDATAPLKAPREQITNALPTCLSCGSLLKGLAGCCCTIQRELICIESEIEELQMVLCSKIEASTESIIDVLGSEIEELQMVLCSKIEAATESIIDFITSETNLIETELELLESQLAACCSLLDTTILSVSDTLTSDLEALSSQLAVCCDDLSSFDFLIKSDIDALTSQLEFCCSMIDTDLRSIGDLIMSDLECGFGIPFGQTDIPFMITTPGTYILCEDITATAATPSLITVASSNVTLNLNGHQLDGAGMSGASGLINIDATIEDVTIQHGAFINSAGSDLIITDVANITITDLTLLGTTTPSNRIIVSGSDAVTLHSLEIDAGAASAILINENSTNTLLQHIIITGDTAIPSLIETNSTSGTTIDTVRCTGITTGATIGIQSTNDSNFTISNCSAEILNTGYLLISANDFEINNSIARSIGASGLGAFVISGPSCQNGLLQDCTVTGANNFAYVADSVANLAYVDCFAINTTAGFIGTLLQNTTWEHCIVEKAALVGFNCTNSQQLTFNECRASKCPTGGYTFEFVIASNLLHCCAQAVGTGISLLNSTTMTIDNCQISQSTTTGIQLQSSPNCIIENSLVNGCTTIGYYFFSNSNGVEIENCRALNTGQGFVVSQSENTIFKNCMVEGTTIGAGFSLGNGSQVVYDQSITLNCAGNGFEALTASDLLYTNCSASNTNNGFFLTKTNQVLYCECAAQSNNAGQFIASNCTNTVIRECCIANNITDIDNFASDTDILCLDDIACAIGMIIPITQATFNNGPVTFSISNHYKLCENVVAAAPTVSITASDVIFDLGEFYMDGITIQVANNLSNVTIRNGQIKNVPFFIDIGANTQNITIENMILDSIVAASPNFGIRVASGPTIGLTIRDITFYNSAPSTIFLSNVSNALLENIQYYSSNPALPGVYNTNSTFFINRCNNLNLNNILINGSSVGIDAINLSQSNDIFFNNVSITASVAPVSGTPAGIRLNSCSNIDHVDVGVNGAGFAYGFFVSNSFAASANLLYTACDASAIMVNGFLLNDNNSTFNISNVLMQDCSSSSNGADGIIAHNISQIFINNCIGNANVGNGATITNSQSIQLTDVVATYNQQHGIDVETCNDIVITGLTATQNTNRGLYLNDTNQVDIEASSFLENGAEGVRTDMVNNIIVIGSDSQHNGHEGFNIIGANGGNIPGDPAFTVGESATAVSDCVAFQNGASGFHFQNVGGVRVTNSFSSYNANGHGFHFDLGSWNVQVLDCVATSNAIMGFLTWDVSTVEASLYNNRLHHCFASQNGTNQPYNILGAADYSATNTPYFGLGIPLAGPISAEVLTLPGGLLVVPPDYCGFF